ncbi:MAG: class 3 adenylate cyclase [Myxococcota bacterium]
MEPFEPILTEPQVSTRVYRGVLDHFSELLGEGAVTDVVASTGLTLAYLRQPEQWVSLEFGERLTQAFAVHIAGDYSVPFEHPVWEEWRAAGRRSVSQEIFGPLWALARALGSPAAFFRAFPLISAQANRLTRFQVMEQGRGLAVIGVELTTDVPSTPAYCFTRMGLFERVPTLWGLPEATVEHPRCIHHQNSAEQCIYIIRYRDRPINAITGRVALAVLCAVLGAVLTVGLAAPAPMLAAALGALGGVNLERWWAHRRDRRARTQDLTILRQTLEDANVLNHQLWEERLSLRRLLMTNQKISGYLDPSLVQRIVEQPEGNLMPGGERVEVAVLFVDIVGYTARCESAEPEQVVADLNTFFAAIDPVIDENDGILDKRIGDAVMAVFVEHPSSSRQARALSCAAGILRAVQDCNHTLRARGAEPIDVRIGISAGAAVQGNLGSDLRYEFTVIGNVVNLAARLEGLSHHNQALAADDMRPWLPDDLQVVSTDVVRVKGRADAVGVMHLALAPQAVAAR